eukprot:comp12300_c0_seq1/m.7142 comp12300_c0_seq1/g.7142  ORF comp12300_c0_seq1/g.7142 comp12300_c0_seq1/m.7142 type:complete len:329 (-) comp12300_c0_seq1:553-1539(-)
MASLPKHFITLKDYAAKDVLQLLKTSHILRSKVLNKEVYRPLAGRSMSMIFEKRSTRTRVSTEAGMAFLGGHALFLSSQDIQLGTNESMRDTAEVLGRLNDLVLARVFKHESILELAQYSNAPIINALSDKYHPLQALADIMTVQQTFKNFPYDDNGNRLTLSWVGDGNNVVHSLLMSGLKLGCNMKVATPKGYECHADVIADAQRDAAQAGTTLEITNDPKDAVHKADVIFTDTWVSMGDEAQKDRRLKDFKGYQVTSELCKNANANWKFMHCLPRKLEEVSDEVFYSDRSLVFPEAENRKYTVMAVMCHLLGVKVPETPSSPAPGR